jgi:hypothetical protein
MESRNLFPAGALCMLVLPGIAWSAPEVIREIYHDTSPPLSSMPAYSIGEAPKKMRIFPLRTLPTHAAGGNQATSATDAALQPSGILPFVSATTGLNFDGAGVGFSGPNGTFTVTGAPSDSNRAVGATQFVEMVNVSLAVFSKSTGAAVMGPVDINTLWSRRRRYPGLLPVEADFRQLAAF